MDFNFAIKGYLVSDSLTDLFAADHQLEKIGRFDPRHERAIRYKTFIIT